MVGCSCFAPATTLSSAKKKPGGGAQGYFSSFSSADPSSLLRCSEILPPTGLTSISDTWDRRSLRFRVGSHRVSMSVEHCLPRRSSCAFVSARGLVDGGFRSQEHRSQLIGRVNGGDRLCGFRGRSVPPLNKNRRDVVGSCSHDVIVPVAEHHRVVGV